LRQPLFALRDHAVQPGGEQHAFRARDTQDTPTLDRARLYLSGEIVTSATPDAARQAVARVAAAGADIVKIRVDDNLGSTEKMAPEVYRAVIDEAHARKLRVAAHIFYLEDAKNLLERVSTSSRTACGTRTSTTSSSP
jgi:imidazolonepropionase-like amidohydrolase